MKIFRFTLLTIAGLLCSIAASAHDFEVDGIYYNITSSGDLTVEVTYEGKYISPSYTGSVVIPETVAYNEKTYSVTRISVAAFRDCSNLTSVTIGKSVTSIENSAFMGCSSLTSITIPNSVTSIENFAFYDCSSLTNITFGNSVTSIGTSVFKGTGWWNNQSNGLVYLDDYLLGYKGEKPVGNVKIKESTKVIAAYTFSSCSDLMSIIIPNSVTRIGNYAFYNCSSLISVNIGSSVACIEYDAFYGCSSLTNILIPNSVVSIGYEAFYGCKALKTVINLSDLSISKGSDTHGYVAYYANKVIDADEQIGDFCFKTEKDVHYLVRYIGGDSIISLPENYQGESYVIGNYAFEGCSGLTNITISNSVTDIEKYAFDGCNCLTSVEVAAGNEVYKSMDGDRAIVRKSDGYVIFSIARNITVKCVSTQTTLTFQISYEEDEYFESCGIVCYYSKYKYYTYEADSEGIVTISNLKPNETVSIIVYSYYDQIRRTMTPYYPYYSTKDIDVNMVEIDKGNGATSLCFQGLYDIGDATFKTSGFTAPSSIESNTILLTGLEPNRSTTVSYYVTVKEGSYTKKQTSTFTTPELQFTTLKAKATSNTKAVICAEANIANEETGTGFEWRRVDAPDIVPSDTVYCAVHDGVMEGILNNLSANTYYQYRPFYKSAAGNMYYGDWIGFGTADAYVYFTPTVHTYATATVENNTATLNGYALAGSDDIVEQGFEYWADGLVGTRAAGEVMTVTATGQRMSTTLTDLAYNTTYRYRAYVKTVKETTYGEEMSFTTGDDPTGIDGVATEDLHIDVRTVQGGIEFRLTGETASSVRYALYTLNGMPVANGAATVGEDWQRISENTIAQGLYLLRVESGKQCQTLKVLVK